MYQDYKQYIEDFCKLHSVKIGKVEPFATSVSWDADSNCLVWEPNTISYFPESSEYVHCGHWNCSLDGAKLQFGTMIREMNVDRMRVITQYGYVNPVLFTYVLQIDLGEACQSGDVFYFEGYRSKLFL